MVLLNDSACIGCGKCVEDCFGYNLTIEDGKAKLLGRCMECGHCVAVCPRNLFCIEENPMEDVLDLKTDISSPSPEQMDLFLKSRRSIRRYKREALPQNILEKIIDAGRFSPTAANRQDVKFYVIQNQLEQLKPLIWDGFAAMGKEMKESGRQGFAQRIQMLCDNYHTGDADTLFFQAPALLVITTPTGINGGLSAAYMELMAASLGVGTLYSGYIQGAFQRNEAACKMFGINGEDICICMLLGYPDVRYLRTVPRREAHVVWG